MKIIVAGSTGFVATEVIRQALSNPAITSIAALGRRATPVPKNAGPDADPAKLKSVVCDNFESYTESVKKDLAGADACIWYSTLFAASPCLITCRRIIAFADR
jgi:nucleoside-diphosphate-sugar epimerase